MIKMNHANTEHTWGQNHSSEEVHENCFESRNRASSDMINANNNNFQTINMINSSNTNNIAPAEEYQNHQNTVNSMVVTENINENFNRGLKSDQLVTETQFIPVDNQKNKEEPKKGAMRFIPNFLSLLPKPKPQRRSSVACLPTTTNRSSRASSVDSQSQAGKPIFSFLKHSEDNPHRTRQPSNLTSRRNSMVSMQKYSSQELP